jgi:crossover junction endodeoxyribonuclease RusA
VPQPDLQRWTLELPFVTPLNLNVHRRQHWSTKRADIRAWRDATCWLAKAAGIPPCGRITVLLLYTPPDNRRRDPLNLVAALKPCEDGLVDAGVIPDDSGRYHTSVMPIITPKGPMRTKRNRVWLEITQGA